MEGPRTTRTTRKPKPKGVAEAEPPLQKGEIAWTLEFSLRSSPFACFRVVSGQSIPFSRLKGPHCELLLAHFPVGTNQARCARGLRGERPGTDVTTIVASSMLDDSPAPSAAGFPLHPFPSSTAPMGRDGPHYNGGPVFDLQTSRCGSLVTCRFKKWLLWRWWRQPSGCSFGLRFAGGGSCLGSGGVIVGVEVPAGLRRGGQVPKFFESGVGRERFRK
jgi:hypothetical protein